MIVLGGAIAPAIAFPLAWVPSLRLPTALAPAVFVIGVATIVAGSALRRHCWRLLGASFTGDVRAHPDQPIVVGEPYRKFMRTRRRLIPFIY